MVNHIKYMLTVIYFCLWMLLLLLLMMMMMMMMMMTTTTSQDFNQSMHSSTSKRGRSRDKDLLSWLRITNENYRWQPGGDYGNEIDGSLPTSHKMASNPSTWNREGGGTRGKCVRVCVCLMDFTEILMNDLIYSQYWERSIAYDG